MQIDKDQYYVAIMAGGVGSRFWPSSRELRPKQFLDITNSGRSLLQQTVDRALRIVDISNILIVSNAKYKDIILDQLPELDASQLLLEPSRNNTGPCVAYTALHLKARRSDAVFAMLPADHVIAKEPEFAQIMLKAFNYAADHDAIMTLGISPSRPDTGYGYIHYQQSTDQIHKVFSFKEKPDLETAQQYLDNGQYLWNAGIFVWSVNTVLASFRKNAPEILSVLEADSRHYGTEQEQAYVDRVYPDTPNISVDFALLESAENVYTIPADIHWNDLGTWNSLYDFQKKDETANVVQAESVLLDDVKGCLIRQADREKLIVVGGLEDYIIIDDDDVLLIYPRHKEQEIKRLRNQIKQEKYL